MIVECRHGIHVENECQGDQGVTRRWDRSASWVLSGRYRLGAPAPLAEAARRWLARPEVGPLFIGPGSP